MPRRCGLWIGLQLNRVELSIECLSLFRLIFFERELSLELITELDNLFKLYLFIFLTNSSLFTGYTINLVIPYIK
jgi:hypothetical protein